MYAIAGVFPDVAPIRISAKIRCSNSAAAGLCSSGSSCCLGCFRDRSHELTLAMGVVVLAAKKRENGSTASLAISCFTLPDDRYQSSSKNAALRVMDMSPHLEKM